MLPRFPAGLRFQLRAWVHGEKMNLQFESWLEHAVSGAQEAQDRVWGFLEREEKSQEDMSLTQVSPGCHQWVSCLARGRLWSLRAQELVRNPSPKSAASVVPRVGSLLYFFFPFWNNRVWLSLTQGERKSKHNTLHSLTSKPCFPHLTQVAWHTELTAFFLSFLLIHKVVVHLTAMGLRIGEAL